jgi:hypothetical protein
MVDSSSGLNGAVGSLVTTGGGVYTFSGPRNVPNHDRLVLVQDDSQGRLDPGSAPYAVTIRLRTTDPKPNIVQKGQNNQAGGFWKLVLKNGYPRCHFEDSTGAIKAIGFVGGPPERKADDGEWHVLRCERTLTGVRLTMDPGTPAEFSRFIRGTIGSIDSRRPFSIGGKVDCNGVPKDQGGVGCDYFRGQLDYVVVEKG